MEKTFDLKKIIACDEIGNGSGIFSLVMEWENPTIMPGQFILIRFDGSAMPRPFSVAHFRRNSVTIEFRVVGKNTEKLSKVKLGDSISVSGPHGKPIPLNRMAQGFILAGGGIGTSGLLGLAYHLRRKMGKKVEFLIGGKTENDVSGEGFLEHIGCKVKTITEHKNGRHKSGYVTDLLEKALKNDEGKSTVIACGPKAMLKKVSALAEKNRNDCIVLLEEVMACGVGSCKGCAVFGKDGSVKHVCTDGPAFDAAWLDWEKLVPETHSTPIAKRMLSEDKMKTVLRGKNGHQLILDRPIFNAAGCLGIEAVENIHVYTLSAGALVTKTVTLEPRTGNLMPRICETPGGMLNSIGLENIGIRRFKKEELPRWLKTGKPIIVNISGFSIPDYGKLARELKDTGIAGIEINVSCPNIRQKGTIFGLHPEMTRKVVTSVRKAAPDMFLITKLSPMATDRVAVAKAAVEGGSDALSGINTILGMAIDIYSRKLKLANRVGGLSGSAIRPLAIKIINELFSSQIGVPLIGMGGITSGEGAPEFILAGANAVAIGTDLFRNPLGLWDAYKTLAKFVDYHGANSIQDLVGKAIS